MGGGNERTALEHFANGRNQIRIGGLLEQLAQSSDLPSFRQKSRLVVHSQKNDPGSGLVDSQLARRANPVEARYGGIRDDEVRDKRVGSLCQFTPVSLPSLTEATTSNSAKSIRFARTCWPETCI